MKITRCFLHLIFIGLLFFCSFSFAQNKIDIVASTDEISTKLDEILQIFSRQRHFMGAVLVAKEGHILLKKGYGMADLEWDILNTTDAKFRLGSITKQFTAVAILQLVQQHKLSLEDKACHYFSQCPDAWKNVTIHQLLSHTSGIPSYTDDKLFMSPQGMRLPRTPTEILLWTKNKSLDFKSGTQYRYDNSGYTFLGLIIEKVSGEKYADYIQHHIFDQLGMKNSGYDNPTLLLHHRAKGYKQCGKLLCNADYIDMSLPYAAGSLYSTVDDLYRWDRSLYKDKLLSNELRQKMFTPVKEHYAYGWDVEPMVHHQQVGHGGGINGFSTYIARFPKDNLVVIVLSNVEMDTRILATSLAAQVLGEFVYLPPQINPIRLRQKELIQYAGIYQTPKFFVQVSPQKGHLMIALRHQKSEKSPFLKAIPFSDTQFYIKENDIIITFVPQTNEKSMQIELKLGYDVVKGSRVGKH